MAQQDISEAASVGSCEDYIAPYIHVYIYIHIKIYIYIYIESEGER